MVGLIKAATETPVCVGFGISNPEQARDGRQAWRMASWSAAPS